MTDRDIAKKKNEIQELPGFTTANKTIEAGGVPTQAFNVSITPYHRTRKLDPLEFPGAVLMDAFDAVVEAFNFLSIDTFENVQHNFWLENGWGYVRVKPGKGFEHYLHLAHGENPLSVNKAKYLWSAIANDSGVFAGFVRKPHPFKGRTWLHVDVVWVSHHPDYVPAPEDANVLVNFAKAASAIVNEPHITHYGEGWWKDKSGRWHKPN